MSTRAIRFLQQHGIAFETLEYEHLAKGAEFAALATGFPLDRTVKTLVVATGPKQFALALVSGDRQLDLKRLARVLGVKKAEMAAPDVAERLTGYHVGGISPFGVRQSGLPVVMDEPILSAAEILVNAGQRGTMLKMAPRLVCAALKCTVAPVSQAPALPPA
jgi:Cys-tRNA(Pro)/Cys-tRNA(Cys) deacylase